ncbi:hypothetical protein [Microbulbifer sediminum]|uniref:hypothetical protein n=1 Tax=Microbulbifer sediminum TaxID=2904250 RepID=UPI001F3CD62A|nr:hypothetical protein [Microbulbifer sediminum]
MSRIPLVQRPADEMVEQVFAEIEDELGSIPNMFRAYANHPEILRLNWERFKVLMMHGCLSVRLKESIALVVSADNRNEYGIARYSELLQEREVNPHEILKIRLDPDHAHLSSKEHALLALAHRAHQSPFDHGEKFVDAARREGATDMEIVEALGVMEFMAGANRFLEVLDVTLD